MRRAIMGAVVITGSLPLVLTDAKSVSKCHGTVMTALEWREMVHVVQSRMWETHVMSAVRSICNRLVNEQSMTLLDGKVIASCD